MNIKIGDYLITSDSMQFIVNKIGTIQEGRFTNVENVGKETTKVIGYTEKFSQALQFIPNDVLKTNDDINIIIGKLIAIQQDIQALEQYPVIFIKEENEITIKKDIYTMLLEEESKLSALEGAGVDNWDNYDYAMELVKGDEIKKEEVEDNE